MSIQFVSDERPKMNRHGKKRRKRGSGAKTATGRDRRVAVDYRALAAGQPHRRSLPAELRLSERAGTVLGSLNLLKRISDDLYEAGRRYGVLVAAYRSVIGTPHGISGNGRGYPCSGAPICENCICRERTDRYMRAYEAISDAGRPAHMAINRVVLDDEIIPADQLEHLFRGLKALARHLGLTSRGKSAQ